MTDFPDTTPEPELDGFESQLTAAMQLLAAQAPTDLGSETPKVVSIAVARRKQRVVLTAAGTAFAVAAAGIGVLALQADEGPKVRKINLGGVSGEGAEPSSSTIASSSSTSAVVAQPVEAASSSHSSSPAPTPAPIRPPAPVPQSTSTTVPPAPTSKLISARLRVNASGFAGDLMVEIPDAASAAHFFAIGLDLVTRATLLPGNTSLYSLPIRFVGGEFQATLPIDQFMEIVLPATPIPIGVNEFTFNGMLARRTVGERFSQLTRGSVVPIKLSLNEGHNELTYDVDQLGARPPEQVTVVDPAVDMPTEPGSFVAYESIDGNGRIIGNAIALPGSPVLSLPAGNIRVTKGQVIDEASGIGTQECLEKMLKVDAYSTSDRRFIDTILDTFSISDSKPIATVLFATTGDFPTTPDAACLLRQLPS